MKNKRISSKVVGLASMSLLFLTSCNRGYGCPYDFSVTDVMTQVLKVAIQAIGMIF